MFPFLSSAITPEAAIINVAEEIQTPEVQITRGQRNNNPGNIRWFKDTKWEWEGQTGTDDDDFVTFDTPLHGWRALLRNTKNQPKNSSIRAYIDKYASTIEMEKR